MIAFLIRTQLHRDTIVGVYIVTIDSNRVLLIVPIFLVTSLLDKKDTSKLHAANSFPAPTFVKENLISSIYGKTTGFVDDEIRMLFFYFVRNLFFYDKT